MGIGEKHVARLDVAMHDALIYQDAADISCLFLVVVFLLTSIVEGSS